MNEDLNFQLVISVAVRNTGYHFGGTSCLLLSRGSMALACLQALKLHYNDDRILSTDLDWINDQIDLFVEKVNAEIWASDDNYHPDDETFMFDPSELPSF